jgi:hypothetical protein
MRDDKGSRPRKPLRAAGEKPASPYAGLAPRAYWRTGVAERAPLDPGDLYTPRFPVTREMRIATAGSCFAQHVGRALRTAGFSVIDAEPLPAAIPDAVAQRFGYRLFSARYGNIYTARQLAQLLAEANGEVEPALPVWQRDGRFFDAQRPAIEPDGFESEALVRRHREAHLGRVRAAFGEADLVVFTFGLTEAWIHRETGTVYPTAPGTVAGSFDPETFAFKNYDTLEVLADFEAVRARLKAANPALRFLVTVSPVPLTATASGDHVEVATCYSKAVLRSVCGMLVARHDDVDYFPSFELITSQGARGAYYETNQRNVSALGVAAAMGLFKRSHGIADAPEARGPGRRGRDEAAAREVCEEALLEAFAE